MRRRIKPRDPDEQPGLRQRAETRASGEETPPAAPVKVEDAGRLLHELRVHQLELEMQNDELRRAQAELELSRERYFELYDLAPVGYLTLEEKGTIREANLTSARMLGMSGRELVQRRLTSLILAEDEDIYYRSRKHLFETGSPQICELRMVRLDGGQFWARLESAVSPDTAGEPICRLVISDITATKQAEERLAQAQKMELVGMLAGGVAHEFNNLMTVVNGYSQLLLDHLSQRPPMRAELMAILRAGTRAAELTRSLLAFARKQVLQPVLMDLNSLVTEMQPLLARLCSENVEVRAEVDPEGAIIRADSHQLEQVLINLVLNARDAMPDGGILSIRTSSVRQDPRNSENPAGLDDGPFVLLTVSDSGTGMNAETRRRIFEPFFTTKEAGKGTGLGLPTVQGIVAQSGGFIDVQSEPGLGTTFGIYLPEEQGTQEQASKPAEAEPEPGRAECILVVEDELDVLDLVTRALASYGYNVIQAGSGSEALRLGEQSPRRIDLLLTDLVMPDFSGRLLAGKLMEQWPALRTLYMSGAPEDALARHGLSPDGVELIQKPFSLAHLALKVRAMLDRPTAC